MKKFTIVYLTIFLSSLCHSESYFYKDGPYEFEAKNTDECYGLGSSSPMLSVCQSHFKNISKNKMESSLNSLVSKLERDKEELIEAQKKWAEFSKLQCQFEAKASESYAKSYNVYTEMYNSCMDKLRIERADYLNGIQTGCAGCVQ